MGEAQAQVWTPGRPEKKSRNDISDSLVHVPILQCEDMGGTKDSIALVVTYVSAVLVGYSWCREGACLQDSRRKAKPGPDPLMTHCMLYNNNSCCAQEHIEEIFGSSNNEKAPGFWDLCGPLSPSCRDYLKRVTCFHRCSPDAFLWAHPHRPGAIQATPLCHSFCADWFEACKNDRTCALNWTTDWAGEDCAGPCMPFHQMYKDERDLCDHMWGDAFVTIEDQVEDGGEGGPCCLTLSSFDREVIDVLLAPEVDPNDSDTNKTVLRPGKSCHTRSHPKAPPQARRGGQTVGVTKRSVAKDDAEGSGSGF
ncbi:hypothetical protein GJAV_G00219800 [Gymnothorax javanicus]|nr:hypothetical protein GJAV_G00219800 [Gymnothorax javanicus]